jgi:predicted ATPase
MGRVDEGLAVLAEAQTLVDHTGARGGEAELYRIRGQLRLQSQVSSPKSKVEEAEGCFHQAIEIARRQQAKSLELRATTSLARLWQQQGKHRAARNSLSETYGWFAEGFATKDLQEAQALLEELT